MEIIKYILEIILDVYMAICTIVMTILILLWLLGKRHMNKLKKIDPRMFNSENKTIN